MDTFLQQVVSGLATGGIYASLALALVMIYQATDVVNYAQGEMAMFSTYLAWSMLNHGVPYWLAFFATVATAVPAATAAVPSNARRLETPRSESGILSPGGSLETAARIHSIGFISGLLDRFDAHARRAQQRGSGPERRRW